MKNSILTFVISIALSLSSLVSYSQNAKADSLMAIFESTKEIEEKQNLLKEIANIYEYSGEWDNYQECARQMLELARQENDSSWIAEAYNKLGISSCYTGQNEKAIEHFTAALEINKAMNEMASVANSYENLGFVYNEMGDFGNAIDCQLKSVDIRKPINYPRLFNNYTNLATLYSAISNEEKRAYYIDLAKKEIASKPGISAENKAVFYSGLGDLYHDKGLNDSSIACYKKVIYYSTQAEWKRGITSGLGSIAAVFQETGELDSAIVYHQKSLKLSEQIDECMSIAEELTALAKIYAKKSDENKAISYAEKALKKARTCKLLEMESQILEFIAGYYAEKGNYQQAYKNYINYKALTDSILSADVINKMAELETQYQTKEKEQQIELLSAQNEITLKEKASQRRFFILLVLALVFISIAFYFLYKNKQKTHKALEKLDDLKMGFFNNVSHELRTPLTLIASPVSQLLQEESDPKKYEYLKLIDRNSQKLLRLVNQLLELSKIDAGFYKLNIEHADLEKLSRKIALEYDCLAKIKNIHFSYSIDATSLVWFDPRIVETLLVNVLSNAFKYTNHHKKVSFELKLQDNRVSFCIKNSCDTVSDETLTHIFNRFYRSDSLEIGTGIGLALVKELIDIYRAKITAVYNSANEMQIDITLPINKTHFTKAEFGAIDPEPLPEIQTEWETSAPFETDENNSNTLPTILIVEDNADMQAYIASCFCSQFILLKANNGQEGVNLAIEHIPDLILSDVMMPVLDGIALCNTLKNNQLTSHIPIILLTAKVGEENTLVGLQNKANDYITKPFSVEALQLKVNNALELGVKMREKYSQELMIRPLNLIFPSSEELFAKNIQQVLNEHLTRPEFDVTQFCDATNLSRTQLHRKLTSLTGLSATAFIRTQRIKLAAEKIKIENTNITDVCYVVGFNDTSYFSKCFKEIMGLTPTEYQMQTSD